MRRTLSLPVTLASALLAAGCALSPLSTRQEPSTVATATRGFQEPPVAANLAQTPHTVEVSLNASVQKVALAEGKLTEMFTYNRSYPGPTLDVREGDRLIVHFKNDLSEATSLHWHGLSTPADQDDPLHTVAPGASRDYAFDIPEGSAGTYWYHPHLHGNVAEQMGKGLFGAIKVRAKEDPIPAEAGDTLMILSDPLLNERGAIASQTMDDQMNGREGNLVMVNGRQGQTLALKPGEVRRIRLLNASNGRYFLLNAPGLRLRQIGSDGGLLEKPVEASEILLSPGERVEVLLQAGDKPGGAVLQSLPYERGKMTMAAAMAMPGMGGMAGMNHGGHVMNAALRFKLLQALDAPLPLVNLEIGNGAPAAPLTVPSTLRSLPTVSPAGALERTFTITENMPALQFLLNGQKFDASRIDLTAKLGSTEVWKVVNNGDMDHPFHLHGFHFQVLDRNGQPEPFRALKDTVNVRKGETLRFVLNYDKNPGIRVYHCHILEHEDVGMMGILKVE